MHIDICQLHDVLHGNSHLVSVAFISDRFEKSALQMDTSPVCRKQVCNLLVAEAVWCLVQ